MHRFQHFIFFCTCSFLLCLLLLSAEESYATDPIGLTAESNLNIGITTIYSPNSFSGWGKIENSTAYSIRGQIWHSRVSFKNMQARLGSELIITHRLNYPVNGIDGPKDQRTGFGIIPLNLMLPLSSSSKVNPFTFFSAGGIFLNDKLPVGDGASFNYLLNIGAGLELSFVQDSKIQLGYSIQHMSNANTGKQNPGIDSHMIFMTILLP